MIRDGLACGVGELGQQLAAFAGTRPMSLPTAYGFDTAVRFGECRLGSRFICNMHSVEKHDDCTREEVLNEEREVVTRRDDVLDERCEADAGASRT